MPQSFINTGEPGSMSVFPSTNFADPRLFGGVYPALGAGIKQGVDLGAELQRNQQAAAMAPLQLENARNVAAMAPIALQQAQINLKKSSMPIPVATGTRPVKINRETGEIMSDQEPLEWAQGEAPKSYRVDPETGELSGEQGQVDENGAAILGTFQAQRRAVPFDIVEQETGYKVNPATGEQVPYTKFGKTIETDEERQKRESTTEAQTKEAQARVEAAHAASSRAKLGANRAYEAGGRMYKDEIDANGDVVQRDLGSLSDYTQSRIALNESKGKQAEATATHQAALAANEAASLTTNKTEQAVLTKWAASFDLPLSSAVALSKTVDGQKVLAERRARLSGTSGSTEMSPTEEAGIAKILAAAPATAPAAPAPVITSPFGNALGAPVEDSGEQGVPAAPALAGPPVHPTPEVYAALPVGAPYIENGSIFHKKAKNK